MQIRILTIEDYEQVYALWLSCKGMGLNDLDDSKEGIARFLDRNPSTCFAATEEGRVIGVIIAGHDGRRGYIYHTAVHPDFRHRGIAKALLEKATDALKECGIHKAALLVFRRNEGGNAFWEKEGFEERTDVSYRNKTLTALRRIDT